MTALLRAAANLMGPKGPMVIGSDYITSTGSAQNLAVPAGTAVGDLIVVAVHGSAASTPPTGFTQIYQPGGDGYGYAVQVCYKVAASGDIGANISVTANQGSGYNPWIFVIRGVTAVQTTGALWTTGSTGGTNTVAGSAKTQGKVSFLLAFDRGAASYPTLSSVKQIYSNSASSLYFRTRLGIYLPVTGAETITYTDASDSYATTGLWMYCT